MEDDELAVPGSDRRPDDVVRVAYPVLRHRVLLTYEAEAENVTSDDVIARVLAAVPAP